MDLCIILSPTFILYCCLQICNFYFIYVYNFERSALRKLINKKYHAQNNVYVLL